MRVLLDESIAVVVLVAVNNRVQTLRALVPELLRTLPKLKPGQIVRIREQGILGA